MDVLASYAHIKGFNYLQSSAQNNLRFWQDYDEALVEREMGYAQRIGLNGARIFLNFIPYEADPNRFLNHVGHFVRAAHAHGVTTMPVVFDCALMDEHRIPVLGSLLDWTPNPGLERFPRENWPVLERYVLDLVETLKDEPGLEMWDVMNEPTVTSWCYVDGKPAEERVAEVWAFVHHFADLLKAADGTHPITCGCVLANNLKHVADHVDVLAFHDYSPTRGEMRANIREGIDFAQSVGKPVIINEFASPARVQPYDVAIQICTEMGIGYYFWELMVGTHVWADIHGIVHPDGTIRDPSSVAAILGFFRKRELSARPIRVDKELNVRKVIVDGRAWLGRKDASHAEGLMILERMANLLEGAELTAMSDLPSAHVFSLTKSTSKNRAEMARLMVVFSQQLAPYREGEEIPPGWWPGVAEPDKHEVAATSAEK